MAPKLYKAADVCELAQLQPYVLRSWEKEFPGIGMQQGPDSPRLYRDSDVEQVQRIKQLVFGEGLTLSGARRRLEESNPALVTPPAANPPQVPAPMPGPRKVAASKPPAAGGAIDDVRTRIASIREGLRSILTMLGGQPQASAADEYQLEAPVAAAPARARNLAARRAPEKRRTPETRRAPEKRRATEKKAVAKRKRASA